MFPSVSVVILPIFFKLFFQSGNEKVSRPNRANLWEMSNGQGMNENNQCTCNSSEQDALKIQLKRRFPILSCCVIPNKFQQLNHRNSFFLGE